jgi:pimeloyl-ACP methyl ester carboxylesterase
MSKSIFVLVHGAWHGGWCYRKTADLLRSRGHHAETPTLTGLGERSHLFSGNINLSTHVTDILNVIRWQDLGRIVLVGHSYGGMVITGVADRVPDKIAALVYLDAIVPGNNQSLYDLVPLEIVKLQLDGAAANGGYAVPPTPAAVFSVNEKDRAWVDAMCTPQPVACMSERLALTGGIGQIRNKVYILAANWGVAGRGFRRYYDQVKDDPAWISHEMPCGHDAMIDMPDLLADLLEQAAAD